MSRSHLPTITARLWLARLLVPATVIGLVIAGAPIAAGVEASAGQDASTAGGDTVARALSDCPVPSTADNDVIKAVYQVGYGLDVTDKVMLSGFEAGWVESHMNNLPCGHSDSLGVFQQRPSQGWGTPAQIMNVRYASNSYFTRAIAVAAGNTSFTAGQVAQGVQRSAFPDRYDQARTIASGLLERARSLVHPHRVGSSVVVQGGVTKVYAGGTEVGSPLLQRVFRPGEGWLPWLNLGGGVVGRPSAVVYEDHLHVFVRGVAAPHRLMQRIYRPGGDWSDWIDHGGALGSDPVAVVERDNLYVFAAGSGSGRPLVQRAHSPGEGWNWIPLGGGLAGPPTVTVYRGELHIFARSTNGQHSLVQRVYNTGRGWGPWIDLGGSLSSDPAALVEGVRVRVFAASNDAARTLSQHVYDPDLGWRLTNLGGGVAGRPAAVTYDGYDHVFVRNPAGGLDQRILRPAGDWSGWVSHGAAIVSDPAAAVERDNLMVFAVGTADTMQLRVHNPDSHTWQWIDLGGPIHG
jgi:hypothetical protein